MSKREMTDSLERPGFLKEVKVVLVGPAKCGKTALVQRFVNDIFSDNYVPTGFEKYSTKNKIGDYTVDYSVWDTSGSGSYDTVRPLAYQDANVFILCFNVAEPESLDLAITKWLPEIRSHSPTIPIILCGCKADLRHSATVPVVDTTTLYMNHQTAIGDDGIGGGGVGVGVGGIGVGVGRIGIGVGGIGGDVGGISSGIGITYEQAFIACQHIGASGYIETCSKYSNATAINEVFEIAAEAALGVSAFDQHHHHPSSKVTKKKRKMYSISSSSTATSTATTNSTRTKCSLTNCSNSSSNNSTSNSNSNNNHNNGKPHIKSEIRKSTKKCTIM